MKLTAAILIALVLGLATGAMLQTLGLGAEAVAVIGAVGPLWVNAIKMTVIPLVLALLVGGIASAGDAAAGGALAARSVRVIAALLLAGSLFAVAASEAVLALWPVTEGTAAALRSAAPAGALPEPPGVAAMLTGLVPSNVFAALAKGDMLAIVLFGLLLGLAAGRIEPAQRDRLAGLARALSDAMMVIVGWIVRLAPAGVFALALTSGYRTGWATAGALAHYVAVAAIVVIGQILLVILPAAFIWGRAQPGRWLAAALPALAVAFSTQSSLATLPTTIKQARDALKLPERVIDVTLPLAVTLLKITSPPGSIAAVLYLAHAYGIELSLAQMAAVTALAVLGSLVTVGVSGAASFFAVRLPMFAAAGLPVEVLPLMLAVDVLIDMWRTSGNVAAHLAAATIVAQGPAPR